MLKVHTDMLNNEINAVKLDGNVNVTININVDTPHKKCKCKTEEHEYEDNVPDSSEYAEEEEPVNIELEGSTPLKKFLDELLKTTGENRKINIIVQTKDEDAEDKDSDEEEEDECECEHSSKKEIEMGMKLVELKNILHDFKESLEKFSKDIGI